MLCVDCSLSMTAGQPPKDHLSIGAIGGGIAGLYSALLLQNYVPGVKVKLFEASNRVGGRIYTYKFSSDPHQYFEAGAMRIPTGNSQASVFQLIDYLNKIKKGSLEVVDYHNACRLTCMHYLNSTGYGAYQRLR